MSTNRNILALLLNDIKNIVFRYIHTDAYNQCLHQYKSLFQQCWQEDLNNFFNEEIGLEAMWRDLCTPRPRRYEIIYRIIEGKGRPQPRPQSLPKNY